MENEGKLKASLIKCDQEREELEKRCTDLERERERTSHSLRYVTSPVSMDVNDVSTRI